jgi:hypothetical protein
MTNLMTNTFCHPRVIHDKFGILGDKSCLSLKIISGVVGVNKKDKVQIRVGASALLWAIWNTRNDFVFNKSKSSAFLQVIHRATHWIHTWSYLQPEELQQDMDSGCSCLETA